MQLIIRLQGKEFQTVQISKNEYTIGRAQENDICLPTRNISRYHAKLTISQSNEVTIVDLGSTNGIWYGNQKTTTFTWENDEDIVTMGDYQLHFSDKHTLIGKRTSFGQDDSAPVQLQPQLPSPSQKLNTEQDQEQPSKPRQFNKTKEILKAACILFIITPFVFFIAHHLQSSNELIAKIEQDEQEKNQEYLANKEQIKLHLELQEASNLLEQNHLDSAKNVVENILRTNPQSRDALSLKQKIEDRLDAQEKLAEKRKSERMLLQKKKQQQQQEQLVSQLQTQLNKQIAAKDYKACIATAKRIIEYAPANATAVNGMVLCSQNIVTTEQAPTPPTKKEKPQELTQLEKILSAGKKALEEGKTSRALRIWAQAKKIDPEKKFEITKTIHKERNSVVNRIAKTTQEQIALGLKARKANDHQKALKHLRVAYKLAPYNKKVKALYIQQLKENAKKATKMYQEAIAYASLGTNDKAIELLEQALDLAQGNNKLTNKLNTKLASLQ